MERKSLFTIFLILVILVVVLIVLTEAIDLNSKASVAEVITEKKEYEPGDSLRVKIRNVSDQEICFSDCYPYYIEAEKEGWKSYDYQPCSKDNSVDSCVAPGEIKAFQLSLPKLEGGLHRLAIPACMNCQNKEFFEDEYWFYSNQFEIK